MCRWEKSIEKLESIQFVESEVLCAATKRAMPRLLEKLKDEISHAKRKDNDSKK